MSKTIVLYVTRSGHSRDLALELAAKLGAEASEIVDLVKRRGVLGFIKTGAQASRKAATPIRDPGVDLASASTVILVEPVWAGNLCPPMRTWFRAHKAELEGKKLGFLATSQGSDPAEIKAKIEAELGPLAAFALLRETISATERNASLGEFSSALGLAGK
jgi:flavodoxin